MVWAGRSAIEIAAAVRQGEASAVAVVEEHLHAIAERDVEIGAFRLVREQAVDEARAVQKRTDLSGLPLAGVPVAVKDNLAVAGESTRDGSKATSAAPAREDHPAVARLRAAGAVVVGLTNVPGGSAAAVAAGMVPVALGNDGLGSLRIPAAGCGVLALKPGPGVVPAPTRDWRGMSENGPSARSAADLALTLSVLAGEPGFAMAWKEWHPAHLVEDDEDDDDDEDWLLRPPRALEPGQAGLRVAYAPQPLPKGFGMDGEFAKAVVSAAARLREAGHTVVEHPTRLPATLGPAAVATWLACAADEAAHVDRRLMGRRALARAGRVLGRLGLDGRRVRDRWRDYGADQWLGNADVLLTPTLATLPPPASGWGSRGLLRDVLANAATAPWNLAGWPALSLPFGSHSSGLPIGLQLISPPAGEPHLLLLAAQLTTPSTPSTPSSPYGKQGRGHRGHR